MIIRLAGFGGQGIVMSSYILGQAASLDGKKAIQNQSYGSESRGGECRGDVIISDREIYELEPSKFDILVAMAQPAYDKFIPFLKPGGTLIVEKDLVITNDANEPENIKRYAISATDIAFTKFNRKIIANMIILGYLNRLSNLISPKILEQVISENVPAGTQEMNLNAMREGIHLAEQEMAAA
ncbi:MAG: 2-oxoacid:acceptor oxidoreductase family protein [Candidatus Zixiibacteriota bacterium]